MILKLYFFSKSNSLNILMLYLQNSFMLYQEIHFKNTTTKKTILINVIELIKNQFLVKINEEIHMKNLLQIIYLQVLKDLKEEYLLIFDINFFI